MSNNTKENKTKVPFVDYRASLRMLCESEVSSIAKKDSSLHRSLQWGYSKSPLKSFNTELDFVWDVDGTKSLITLKVQKNGNVRFHVEEVNVESTVKPVAKD